MDAAGLRVICEASQRAEARQRRLTLLRGPANIDRLFTLTGLNEKLDIIDADRHEKQLTPTRASPNVRDVANMLQRTTGTTLTGRPRRPARGRNPHRLRQSSAASPRQQTEPSKAIETLDDRPH